jgi:hypothetical protein
VRPRPCQSLPKAAPRAAAVQPPRRLPVEAAATTDRPPLERELLPPVMQAGRSPTRHTARLPQPPARATGCRRRVCRRLQQPRQVRRVAARPVVVWGRRPALVSTRARSRRMEAAGPRAARRMALAPELIQARTANWCRWGRVLRRPPTVRRPAGVRLRRMIRAAGDRARVVTTRAEMDPTLPQMPVSVTPLSIRQGLILRDH